MAKWDETEMGRWQSGYARDCRLTPFLGRKVLYPQRSLDYNSIRDKFSQWMYSRVSEEYAKKLTSYLDKYAKGEEISNSQDIFKIKEKASSKKYIVIALRNLLNFAEEMGLLDDVQITKMRKVLKVVKSNPDNYIPSTAKVKEVYGKIDKPEYKLLFQILAYSGIRIIEGVNFLRTFDKDKLEIMDNFARYPLMDIRHSKRVYYVYIPLSIALKLRQVDIPMRKFKYYVSKKGLPAKYLRKWNYNFLIMNNVPESVADFIQGRSPVSIGSMHYLAKVKQADFWYSKLTLYFPIF